MRRRSALLALCVALSGTARADSARPLRFEEAVRRAMERNVQAVVAQHEIRRAEALLRQARAGSLPTLSLSGTYVRLDDERSLGEPGTASYRVVAGKNQVQANVALAVPIVHSQRWLAWSRAGDGVEVARLAANDARRQVALAAARAYLAVVAARRVLDVCLRARETAKSHHAYAQARRMGGLGNRVDEIRAAQEVATTEVNVQAAEAALLRAREALGLLVGADEPLDAAEEPLLPDGHAVDAAMESAERMRADIAAARARSRLAERTLKESWADFAPALVGTFQPFFQDPPSLVNPRTGWQFTLSLSLSLYDGGMRYGLRRERAALAAEAKEALAAAVRQARSEVRVAAEAVRRADAALAAAKDAAALARQALELATLAYKAGATTNIEVVDAERRARDAETAAAVAEDAARQARLDLLAASGRFP